MSKIRERIWIILFWAIWFSSLFLRWAWLDFIMYTIVSLTFLGIALFILSVSLDMAGAKCGLLEAALDYSFLWCYVVIKDHDGQLEFKVKLKEVFGDKKPAWVILAICLAAIMFFAYSVIAFFYWTVKWAMIDFERLREKCAQRDE